MLKNYVYILGNGKSKSRENLHPMLWSENMHISMVVGEHVDIYAMVGEAIYGRNSFDFYALVGKASFSEILRSANLRSAKIRSATIWTGTQQEKKNLKFV